MTFVWGGYDVGGGPPHPAQRVPPGAEPWTCAELSDAANTAVGTVWVADDNGVVEADFTFNDDFLGTKDAAVLPLVVDGFFGANGHTLGYYRGAPFTSVRFTNLRTGTAWNTSWAEVDRTVGEMKATGDFVPRRMR